MLNQNIGPYRVLRLLGEGGMGVVYEAVRDDIAVRAAVKVLRPEFARNQDIAARFFNEARAANMIQHAGIVRIFDYGHLPTGEAYLAMEYLEGDSLRGRLDREKRLNEAETMRLGRQVASALASAHSKQIIHRDLKPENIMLVADAETPGGERAKLLDFGIAKLDSGASGMVRTRTNTMMGTPIYMAPEQCRGIKTIDDRVDVYALGVMLFEMLAGQPPFFAEAPGDIIGMHMFQQPPTLSSYVPDCDPSLNRLIARMLGKEPQSRPHMNEVAQTLKALGNLVSDVLPMQIISELDTMRPPQPAESVSRSQRAPMPALEAPAPPPSSPSAAPPMMGNTDPERTVAQRRGHSSSGALAVASGSGRELAAVAERLEPISASPKRPPRSAAPEDSTEVMTSGRLPVVQRRITEALAPDDATAPIMKLREVQKQRDEYLRKRAAAKSSWQSAERIRYWTSNGHAALKRRWEQRDKRSGLLVFGALFLIGVLLGLLILFSI